MKKILIVDDDIEMSAELAEVLKEEGFFVSILNEGEKTLEMIKKDHFDVILLDLKMPNINGLDILKSIRDEKLDIKVMVVTGTPLSNQFLKKGSKVALSSYAYDIKDNILKKADYILNKPFDIEKIIKKIREFCSD